MTKKTRKLDLRVTSELYEQLRQYSYERDIPVARIIRSLITNLLKTT